MIRHRWLGLAAFVCAFASAGGLEAQASGRVVGVVVDSVSGQPLESVHVHLLEQDRHFLTADAGRFLMLDVHGDSATLSLDIIGYRDVNLRIPVGGSELVTIRMVRSAVAVEGILVEGEAARLQAELSNPRSATRLSEAEVTRQRGQTLGATIEDVEGVAIIQYGPALAKPVVRGLHSQRIVVSNGGVRQEGQQWGGEHAPEIDVFAVHEIEVIRGAGSVLHGSDALGGVLRVEPQATPSGSGVGGELVFNGFSNNRQVAGSAMIEHGQIGVPGIGEVGARARVSLRKSGDAQTPSYNLTNTGFSELNLGLTTGVVRPWGSVQADYSLFTTEIGLYSGAHVGNFDDLLRAMEQGPAITQFTYSIANPRQEVTHHTVRLEGHRHLDGIGTWETVYGFQLNKRREFDSHGPLASQARPAFGLDLYTHSLESLIHHGGGAGVRGSIGASLSRQGNLSKGKGFLIPQYRLYTGAAFVSEEMDIGRLSLSAGIRYEYRWQEIFEFGDAGIDVPGETRSYDGVSGSLGLSVRLADVWSVGASVGRGWRAPNVNERFSQGVHHGTAQYELGDASLGSERIWNTDVTLRRAGDRLDLQTSLYRNTLDGYIYLEPREPVLTIRGAFPAFYFRQTDATISGGEASVTIRPTGAGGRFELAAGGSILRGSDRVGDVPLYDMPADRFRFSARTNLPSTSALSEPFAEVSFTVVREQTRVPESIVYALPTDGYTLVNAELGAASLNWSGRHLEVGLEVRNLLDTQYRDYLSRYKLFVDDPGRDIVLRLRMPLHQSH